MTSDIKYQAQIDRNNRNNSHTLALHFALGGTMKPLKILEVGCSAGYFGAALKQLGHHVCGVEMDPASSAQASQVLDEVHCCTVQAFFEHHAGRQFDVITFGDVLEHLTNPMEVLAEARSRLTPAGRIVCSVPNVAHASVRGMLMQGDWDYSDLGILDRTHLRFFTRKTLVELFENAGFLVQKLQAVRLSPLHGAQMCGIELKSNTLKMLEELSDDDTQQDFQYVLSAVPKSATRDTATSRQRPGKHDLRILATSDDPSLSIARIRLQAPLQAFADENCRILQVKSFGKISTDDVNWADVVVIQRGASRHARRVAEWCLESHKPFIYEIDDLLTEMPDFLAGHHVYAKHKALIEQLIRQAAAVTVTNKRLQEALSHLTKSIWICPSYHTQLGADIHPSDSDSNAPTNLIIESSDKIGLDFISPALIEIKHKYHDQVNITAIGPIGSVLQRAGLDCRHMEAIANEACVPTMAKLPNAIGLIPLDDSKFSSCRSSIKFLDYAVVGIAAICSNVPPYKDDVTHDIDGLLVLNTVADWVAAISRLIEDQPCRERLARTARENVTRNHGMQCNTDAWTHVIAAILPEGTRNSRPAQSRHRKLSLKRLKDYLRLKNHQRKTRQRELRRPQ